MLSLHSWYKLYCEAFGSPPLPRGDVLPFSCNDPSVKLVYIKISFVSHREQEPSHLDDWLTVLHRSITLVNFQLDAQNSSLFTYNTFIKILYISTCFERGHTVAQLVEALCYKPEGRGFDSRWCH